jgi:hypothetical protein
MSDIPMDMTSNKVQGLIAAIIRAADSGYLSAIRLELKNHEGLVDVLTTDTSMLRSHSEPQPLTDHEAAILLADTGVHITTYGEEQLVH